jgi:hypothetical protein
MRRSHPLGIVLACLLACLLAAACAGSSVTTSGSPAPGGSAGSGAGQASPSVTPATPSPTGFATACVNLQDVDCIRIRDVVLSTLPAGGPPIAYVEVGPFTCTVDPCPETIAQRPAGRILVEFADGSEPTVLDVAVQAGEVTTREAQDVFLVPVLPASNRLPGPRAEITLGHCGLLSGIDIDGSYWDATGHVDMTHADSINAAEAVFTLVSPAEATLVTAGGLSLELVRHPGGKHLPACM